MLKRNLAKLLFAVMLMTEVGYAAADTADQYELVNIVRDRKVLMFDMQDAYLALLAINRDGSADLSPAAAHAQTIGEKIDGFVELLLPDTAVGQVPNSRAKPEIWTDVADFAATVETLKSTAAALADTATDGNREAFEEQFTTFSEACLGCHGLKPSSEGKYRSPK